MYFTLRTVSNGKKGITLELSELIGKLYYLVSAVKAQHNIYFIDPVDYVRSLNAFNK